jgi:hypothetical protein
VLRPASQERDELAAAFTGGDLVDRAVEEIAEAAHGSVEAEAIDGGGAAVGGVLADGLADDVRAAEGVAEIVGDLVGLAEGESPRPTQPARSPPPARAPASTAASKSAPVLARW